MYKSSGLMEYYAVQCRCVHVPLTIANHSPVRINCHYFGQSYIIHIYIYIKEASQSNKVDIEILGSAHLRSLLSRFNVLNLIRLTLYLTSRINKYCNHKMKWIFKKKGDEDGSEYLFTIKSTCTLWICCIMLYQWDLYMVLYMLSSTTHTHHAWWYLTKQHHEQGYLRSTF